MDVHPGFFDKIGALLIHYCRQFKQRNFFLPLWVYTPVSRKYILRKKNRATFVDYSKSAIFAIAFRKWVARSSFWMG